MRLPKLLGCLVLAAMLTSATVAMARPPTPVAVTTDVSSQVTEAPLRVFNRTIAVFRVPFLGVTAEDRAARTRRTVDDILFKAGPGVVKVETAPQGNLLMIDGELAVILTPEDADRLRNESLDAATQAAVAALNQVIAETKEARDRTRLLRSLVSAGIATAIFLALAYLIVRARRWLRPRVASLLQRKAAGVSVGGEQLLHADRLAGIGGGLVSAMSWLLLAMLAYQWLSYTFTRFPYTRPWGEGLIDFLLNVVRRIVSGAVSATPDLLVAIFMFLIARGVVGLVDPFFDRVQAGRSQIGWLDADTVRPTRRLFRLSVWLFTIVMAYPYLPGAETEAFKGMSLLIGAVVTIGGSGLFSQLFSGFILMYTKTLRVGEYVRVNDHEGTVVELGTFTTRIRTGLGEELAFPNAVMMASVTKNYSRAVEGPGLIVDTTLTIGYDTPWRQVEAMLIEAAGRTPGVLAEPAPRVFQTGLNDFYPEYRLVCQAIPERARARAEVLAALHANIQDVFNENAVQIMSPHYLGDPAAPKVVPKQRWFTPPGSGAGGGGESVKQDLPS